MEKTNGQLFELVVSGISVVSESPKNATNQCFKKGFAHRDPGIDFLIRGGVAESIKTGSCHELVDMSELGVTFLDMARNVLGVGGNIAEKYIVPLLIENSKTFSLFQIEDLHQRFVDGERELCFNENGFANMFFAHGLAYGGPNYDLAVIEISLEQSGWHLYAHKISAGRRRGKGCKLFLRG